MYSELVDIAVSRSVRPDRKSDCMAFANQTIREMSSRLYFAKNLVEDQIMATADPFIFPRPMRIQRFRTARYADGSFPDFAAPGRRQADLEKYYYASSTYFVFKGCLLVTTASNATIDIAYYQFPKNLKYYAADVRPAVYNQEQETWTYLPAYDVDDTTRATARALVSNWLLTDWNDLVTEGTLAKVFKAVNDETRASTHFSFFERAFEGQFLATEIYETFDK